MRKLQGREKTMLVLLGGAALWFVYFNLPTGVLTGGSSGKVGDAGKNYGEPPLVELALLSAGADPYDPAGRDLFKYYTPPPPPRKATPPPPPPQNRPKPPPRRNVAPPKPKAPEAPPPNFDYLGYLGPKDKKIAVFGAGEEVMLAGVGELITDSFRLEEFRYETVVLAYETDAFRGKTTELKMRQK